MFVYLCVYLSLHGHLSELVFSFHYGEISSRPLSFSVLGMIDKKSSERVFDSTKSFLIQVREK